MRLWEEDDDSLEVLDEGIDSEALTLCWFLLAVSLLELSVSGSGLSFGEVIGSASEVSSKSMVSLMVGVS